MGTREKCIVLVVDDEQMMEEYIEELLQRYGYEHQSFTSPAEALEFFSVHRDEVDLIISDIKMPAIDGFELTRKAALMRPDIPVILLSGYSETLPDAATLPNVRALLEKPLLKTDLLQAVEGVLKTCRTAAPG